jgi:pimeloyl-ACP methyl ester carboxylesterase
MDTETSGGPVTVALVHGAYADSSCWNGVVERLMAEGIPMRAVVNPLRGISLDAAYVAGAFGQIPGRVLAVGHSYGGAVITNAASRADNVAGLVYIAAFAPDDGETLQEIETGSQDSVLLPKLRPSHYPIGTGPETADELWIDPAAFHEAFAADLSEQQAAVLAATQRPIAVAGFTEKTTGAAWKKLPSWAVVPTEDHAAGSDVLLSMAKRAGAEITETPGSHVIMISRPEVVVDAIKRALRAVA